MMKDNHQNNDTLSESFQSELDKLSRETVLDPSYRKRKLVLWTIRTILSVILYILFWKHDWVKWTLLLTIPLSVFSLFMILVAPHLMERKIERTRRNLAALDKAGGEAEET